MKKAFINALLIAIGISVFAADQAIKNFLLGVLRPSQSVPIIKGIFHITLVVNTGCAFGLFSRCSNLIFLAATVLAVILLSYFLNKLPEEKIYLRLAAILILSGALSNMTDRLRFGHVIDFLDFRVWPVFNFGDSAISAGVAIFVLNIFVKNKTNP